MAEQWLSIVEYARTYAVSDMTVRRRIKTGRLKAVLREGKYYIPVGIEEQVFDDIVQDIGPSVQIPNLPPQLPKTSENPLISQRQHGSHQVVPGQIASNLQRFESSLVDSQALLQFCEHSVTRINSIERHLQDSFHSRIQVLESQVKLRDQTIGRLKEQIEDLQILVKLMEQQTKSNVRG